MRLHWGSSERAGLQQRALALEKQPAGRREEQQQEPVKKRLGDLVGEQGCLGTAFFQCFQQLLGLS